MSEPRPEGEAEGGAGASAPAVSAAFYVFGDTGRHGRTWVRVSADPLPGAVIEFRLVLSEAPDRTPYRSEIFLVHLNAWKSLRRVFLHCRQLFKKSHVELLTGGSDKLSNKSEFTW